MLRLLYALVLVVPLSCTAEEEPLAVQAWSRATPPGSGSAAIYGLFVNNTDTARVAASVSVPGARHVMVHATVEENGMARMRHGELTLPAGEEAVLAPGGLHIMVMGLERPFVEGCRYPFSITWRDGAVTHHETLTGSFGQSEMPSGESLSCP